jgi:hypothetical protein
MKYVRAAVTGHIHTTAMMHAQKDVSALLMLVLEADSKAWLH